MAVRDKLPAVTALFLIIPVLLPGARSIPPPTPTPFLTSTPGGCRTDEGQQLYPGQQETIYFNNSCKVCSCHLQYGLACSYNDCLPPMCVDPVKLPRECCMKCPNGKNCRIPATGEVIDAGEPVHRDGMTCECPPQSYMLPGEWRKEHYTAVCTLSSTTTTPPIVGRR